MESSASGSERTLAVGIASGVERLIGLVRSLSPPDGLSLTAAATLATLERSGPRRLTALAVQEGVTQPAMTQLVARLQDSGLCEPSGSPGSWPGSARRTRPRSARRCPPSTRWPAPGGTTTCWPTAGSADLCGSGPAQIPEE